MNEIFELKMREISPADGHYFFGYYDLQPYHPNGRFHLAHKVQFVDRLPEADDVAELGYIDLETQTFHKIAETTAWNFQQEAMLQWYGEDHILYNVRKGDHFETAITNWKNDEEILMVYGTGVVGFYPFKHALFRMEDQTPHKMWIPEKQLIGDVHCLYSPDRRYISGDGYPGREDHKRKLYLYDTETEQCIVLAAIPVTDPPLTDLRCDLHARWNPAGDKISLDSNATGRRTIMEIDLKNMID